ncbi:RNA methyltransferase substrate-binding domain-containing protein, partial [Helicobacter cinaedi]
MIIYGKQPILYAIETCPCSITEFYLAKELPRDLFSQLAKLDKPIKRVDNKKAQALSRGGNHQGILAQ